MKLVAIIVLAVLAAGSTAIPGRASRQPELSPAPIAAPQIALAEPITADLATMDPLTELPVGTPESVEPVEPEPIKPDNTMACQKHHEMLDQWIGFLLVGYIQEEVDQTPGLKDMIANYEAECGAF